MRISDWSSDVCSSDLWQETARLLGLRPDPDTDGELKPIKGGLADNKKWGARRVQEIARRDIRELIDGIEERGAPVAANRTLAAVRKMFNWAVERDIPDASPVDGIQHQTGSATGSERGGQVGNNTV